MNTVKGKRAFPFLGRCSLFFVWKMGLALELKR